MVSGREITENTATMAAFGDNGRRRRFTCKKSKGSSIVEMMVAILVLMMVLMSMFGMFLISKTAIYNKDDETANAIALRYLEELEGRPFAGFHSSFNETRDFGKFKAKASVIGDVTPYMATVRVEVKWEAAAMGAKRLSFERIISVSGSQNVG